MSAAVWTPDPENLTFVIDTLQEIFVPDTEIQKGVQQKINVLRTYPDFINYLLFILSNSDGYSEDIRAVAGLLLKNNINISMEKLTDEIVGFIKQKLLLLLSDKSRDVRGCVTSLITTILGKSGFETWPELLPALSILIDQPNDHLSETALSALYKIYEDTFARQESTPELDKTKLELIEKLLPLLTSHRDCVRVATLRIFNLIHSNDSLPDSPAYLSKLFQIIDDTNIHVQKQLCDAFLTFMDLKEDLVSPYVSQIIEYMLPRMESPDSDAAIQVNEFWVSVTNSKNCNTALRPYLPQILPVILRNMQYSAYELSCLKDLSCNDSHLDDDPSDVKPFNCEDEFDDLDDNYIGWTLRKASAAALDHLAVKYNEEILPIIIPMLTMMLNDENDVLKQESGILALGAIAEGCHSHLKLHLPQLLDYLKNCIKHSGNLIKIIAFWTMSRYMHYIVGMDPVDVYFVPILSELLTHILDDNKRVQRSALSAFCIFQEEARMKLVPYLDFIVNGITQAMGHCKFRSFYLLYDAITSLALSVRGNLTKPEYMDRLITPLMQKYVSYQEPYDDQFLGLSEAVTNIITALDMAVMPYTESLFYKSLTIISETIESCPVSDRTSYDQAEKDTMCAAHDLILALANAIKSCFVKFIMNSSLMQTLFVTMQDDCPHVRQCAFVLFGEVIKLCCPLLVERMGDYIPIAMENLDTRFEGVCNNAAWLISEICLNMGASCECFAGEFLGRFKELLANADGTKPMYQTIAVAFCSLGYVLPHVVAPFLEDTIRPVCKCIRNVRDCTEKEIAFRGLCASVCINPQPIAKNFGYFCDAVASFDEVKNDFRDIVKGILVSAKEQYADDIDLNFDPFPDALKSRLHYLYGV